MKRGWMLFLLLVSFAGAAAAHGQVSAYGEFTAANLQGGPQGNYLYGATGGILFDGPKIFKRYILSADLDGTFLGKNGERLDGVTFGVRLSPGPLFFKLAPFIGGDVGFARYNDGANNTTTDNVVGARGGISRRVTARFDAVVDYRYEYYGYNFGFYHPSTYSGGVIYHFAKR